MKTNKRPETLPKNDQPRRIRGPFEDLRVVTTVEGESMTDDSHGNDTDVNNIIRRFDRTGQLPTGRGEGQFADVAGLNEDLTVLISRSREALDELEAAQAKQNEIEEQQTQETTPPETVASEPVSDQDVSS